MSNSEMYKVRHTRKTLEEIVERAQALLKLLGEFTDQVEETNTMAPITEEVEKSIMAATRVALARPGAVVSMAVSRAVQPNVFDSGTSKIYGPTTFQVTIIYDEWRKK